MARRRGPWSVGEEIAYRVFRAAARLAGSLPIPTAARLGRFAGRIAWPFARRRRDIARENLSAVFGSRISDRRREAIAFRSFAALFQDALVLLTATNLPTSRGPSLIGIVNGEILSQVTAGGSGAILVSSHMSNFYVALGYLGRLGFKIAALVRPFAIRPAQRVLEELSGEAGLLILDQGKSVLRLTRHLKAGGLTWFTLDQNARNGVLVEFLGLPATTFAGPVRLARRLGLPIVPAFVHQKGPCFYELQLRPPIRLPRTPGTEEEVLADLRQLIAVLEREIRRHPHEWLWCHRRWRQGERLAR